jgi:hypothetical protein
MACVLLQAGWLWIVVIALDAVRVLKRGDAKRFKLYQHIVWVIASLTLVTFVVDQDIVVDDSDYCVRNSFDAKAEVVLLVLYFLCYGVSAVAYFFVVQRALRHASESAASYLAVNSRRYLLVFCICWLPALVGTAMQWQGSAIVQIQALIEPLQGLLNVFVYYVSSRSPRSTSGSDSSEKLMTALLGESQAKPRFCIVIPLLTEYFLLEYPY